MRGHEQQRHGAEDALQALIAADPYQGENRAHPHLFIVARPGGRCPEMCRAVITADAGFHPLLTLLTGVTNDIASPLYNSTAAAPDSILRTLMNPQRITGGVALKSTQRGQPGRRTAPPGTQDRRRRRSELVPLLRRMGRRAVQRPPPERAVRPQDRRVLARTPGGRRGRFAQHPIPGSWHIGIALTGIRGYRRRTSDWPDNGPPCTEDAYLRVERFNLATLEHTPGDVADKLLGRLIRGLQADADPAVKALLTDPATDADADNLDED